MAKNKSPQGEMRDVKGIKGATLTVLPENDLDPAPAARPDPQPAAVRAVSAPAPKKVVRLNIQAEFGGFQETAESVEAAMARAEQIVAEGVWQKVGSQMILHSATTIHRVVVSE